MEAFNMQLLRVFDWLLWTTIQGSVLIVLIVLLQLIFRRRLPVRWHYFLWVLLLIRLASPWLPESKMSIFNLVPRSFQQGRIIESFSQSRSADPMDFYMYGRYASTPQKTEESETLTVRFVRALPAIWLAGTLIIAGYILFRSIRLWRIVKRERPITDSEILDLLEDSKMQMNVQTIIGVIVSDRIKSPALFGFIRPRLLLPQGMLETFGHDELRYVFIHELAHLKQRDIYLGWLMALLHVVHWFNPLMWFAFGRMRADREMACDTLAISTMAPDEPPKYGRTIVSLLERFSQVRYLPSVAGILEDTCQMERRIKMIADYKKTPRPRWAGAMLLFAVLACVVLTNTYVAKADFYFSAPVNLGSAVNTSLNETAVYTSTDDLTLSFYRGNAFETWFSTRATRDAAWGDPVNYGPWTDSLLNEIPTGNVLSFDTADGLETYLENSGEHGGNDLYVYKRETNSEPWGPGENLGPVVNSGSNDWWPSVSRDGLELYFTSDRPNGSGNHDLWVTRRATRDAPWTDPENLGPEINSISQDLHPCLSTDGLILFFNSKRSGGYGKGDLYITRRASRSDPWEEAVNLGPLVNSSALEGVPFISADGSTLYFDSGRTGGYGGQDIWKVSILPIVDFNSDGNIDTDDLLILIGYWGQNEPLCDIGPMPYGDGIVDIKDLEVFMSYWEKENMPDIPVGE